MLSTTVNSIDMINIEGGGSNVLGPALEALFKKKGNTNTFVIKDQPQMQNVLILSNGTTRLSSRKITVLFRQFIKLKERRKSVFLDNRNSSSPKMGKSVQIRLLDTNERDKKILDFLDQFPTV